LLHSADPQYQDDSQPMLPRCCYCNSSLAKTVQWLEGPKFAGAPPAYICSDCAELCSAILRMQKQRLSGSVGEPDERPASDLLRRKIEQVLAPLADIERQIIKLRNGLEDGYSYSADEISGRLNLSVEQVLEIEIRARATLLHMSHASGEE
jgi:Sigma-70, region 4/ClpX C4-type zinc finger